MNQDYIVQATKGVPLGSRMNVAKEALQRHLLASLQNEGLLTNAAFIGGTALRLLHELPRYSEDLEFIWKNKAAEDQLPKWNKCLLKAVKTLGAVPGFDAKYKSKDDAKVPKRGLSIWVNSTAPAFTPFAPHGIQTPRFSVNDLKGRLITLQERRQLGWVLEFVWARTDADWQPGAGGAERVVG